MNKTRGKFDGHKKAPTKSGGHLKLEVELHWGLAYLMSRKYN